jgi:hypothetical protein
MQGGSRLYRPGGFAPAVITAPAIVAALVALPLGAFGQPRSRANPFASTADLASGLTPALNSSTAHQRTEAIAIDAVPGANSSASSLDPEPSYVTHGVNR